MTFDPISLDIYIQMVLFVLTIYILTEIFGFLTLLKLWNPDVLSST